MKTQFKVLSAIAFAFIVAIVAVSAYTFTLNSQVVLQGTTFPIDGTTFRQSGSDIQVNLQSSWYDICPESYEIISGEVRILEDVTCSSQDHLCSEAGGGCGGH